MKEIATETKNIIEEIKGIALSSKLVCLNIHIGLKNVRQTLIHKRVVETIESDYVKSICEPLKSYLEDVNPYLEMLLNADGDITQVVKNIKRFQRATEELRDNAVAIILNFKVNIAWFNGALDEQAKEMEEEQNKLEQASVRLKENILEIEENMV